LKKVKEKLFTNQLLSIFLGQKISSRQYFWWEIKAKEFDFGIESNKVE
jgi:hypothetical protein